MPIRRYTVEVLDSDAGCAIVVGKHDSGYAVVRYSKGARDAVEQVERDTGAQALRRLRRFAVPQCSLLHEQTIERWETIHGGRLSLITYRKDHNG